VATVTVFRKKYVFIAVTRAPGARPVRCSDNSGERGVRLTVTGKWLRDLDEVLMTMQGGGAMVTPVAVQ
jgi:hypothetical protein